MKKIIALLLTLGAFLGFAGSALAVDTWHISRNLSSVETNYDLDDPDPMLGYHVLTFDGVNQSWLNLDLFRDDILNVELPQYHFVTAATVSTATSSLQAQINNINATTTIRSKFSASGPVQYNSSTGVFSLSTSTLPAHIERIRVQTDSSGAYTFTFNQAFSGTPVVSVDVENTTAGITQAYITSVSSTAVSVQTARAINVLGLLTLQSSPQLTVDIVAVEP